MNESKDYNKWGTLKVQPAGFKGVYGQEVRSKLRFLNHVISSSSHSSWYTEHFLILCYFLDCFSFDLLFIIFFSFQCPFSFYSKCIYPGKTSLRLRFSAHMRPTMPTLVNFIFLRLYFILCVSSGSCFMTSSLIVCARAGGFWRYWLIK